MYYFFLGAMQLPVPPAKMSVKISGKNRTVSLINEGEVNIIKDPGLTEITFDARFPNNRYPWANYDCSLMNSTMNSTVGTLGNSLLNAAGNMLAQKFTGVSDAFSFKKAEFFIDRLEAAKTSRQPFRFIVTRMNGVNVLFSTNMLVTLEDYSIEEDANRDGTDVTCPLKLKQYRPYGTKTATMETDENGNKKLVVHQTRPSYSVETPSVVDVQKAVTCWEVCRLASGGKLNFRDVMTANGISNPLESMAGKRLKL